MKTKSMIKLLEGFGDDQVKFSKDERKAFLENIRNFSRYSESIYRSAKLAEIAEEIGQTIKVAQQMNLQETDGWFDNVTVSRHNKRMEEAYKTFQNSAKEVSVLQQRMESAYEDIAETLKKYYDV
jgi:phage-related minor tail protein